MGTGEVCAYCRRRPVDPKHAPFCSDRCRMADLGRWLSGDYRAAGDPLPAEDDDPDAETDR
ncbi:MAG TPA: DNA gyrase inhibitor YacG [Vicinamibacterales bacterium]|nr:DNA gyrase inhibitor YacG [Vicinamibacterales bacterium]